MCGEWSAISSIFSSLFSVVFTGSWYGESYQFRSDLLVRLYLEFKGVPVNGGVIKFTVVHLALKAWAL